GLVADPQRNDEARADVRRADVPRVSLHVGDVLQAAVLDDPPADPGPARERLTDERDRRSERGADREEALLVDGREEAVLVAHGVADDPEQPAREFVEIEDGGDLRGEALQDRELA